MIDWLRHIAVDQTSIKITANDIFGEKANAPTKLGQNEIQNILGLVYMVAGMVAVLAIIIGAVRFMAAGGDSGKVASAKNVITYAVVGLVVVLVAALATNWIIDSIAK